MDDGPEKVKRFKVPLNSDALPTRARARKCACKHRDIWIKDVKMLQKKALIKTNPGSRWFSPVVMVPKAERPDQFRMTVDCIYGNSHLNQCHDLFQLLK